MSDSRIKISSLPPCGDNLHGLITIGVDGNGRSVQVPLGQLLGDSDLARIVESVQENTEDIEACVLRLNQHFAQLRNLQDTKADASDLVTVRETANSTSATVLTTIGSISVGDIDTLSPIDTVKGRILQVVDGSWTVGWLMSVKCDNNIVQMLCTFCRIDDGGHLITDRHDEQGMYVYKRYKSMSASAWSPWQVIGGDGLVSEISALRAAGSVATTDSEDSDLDIRDERGNVLAEFAGGHIKTKKFNSSEVLTADEVAEMQSVEAGDSDNATDLDITDERGNILASFGDGHIRTKHFDSSALDVEVDIPIDVQDTEDGDLDVMDDNGNVVLRVAGGHIKTKRFDSSDIHISGGGSEGGSAGDADISVEDTEADLEIADADGNVVLRVDGGHIKTRRFDSSEGASNSSLRMLVVGNSYSADSLSYVPALLEEKGIAVDMCIAHYSGAMPSQHVAAMTGDLTRYTLQRYSHSARKWLAPQGSQRLSAIVPLMRWDIIAYVGFDGRYWTEADGSNSRWPATSAMQPYISRIFGWLMERAPYSWKGAFVLQAPYPTGCFGLDGATQGEYFTAMLANAGRIVKETGIEMLIPCGTAVQNLRASMDCSGIGTTGDLSDDNLHLQEGIGPLCAGYAAAQTLLGMLAPMKSVRGSAIRPTDEWLAAQNIPGQNGSSVGVTEENVATALRCALAAVKNPLEVNAINY